MKLSEFRIFYFFFFYKFFPVFSRYPLTSQLTALLCKCRDLLWLSFQFSFVETTALLTLISVSGEPTALPGESSSAEMQGREPAAVGSTHLAVDRGLRGESVNYAGKCSE